MQRTSYFLVLTLLSIGLYSQEVDLLIKGGHVIDPKNSIDAIMDIAIDDGKIVAVAESISPIGAFKVVNAQGKYVVPGIIDIHTHNFWGTTPNAYLSNSFAALPPDGFTFRAGVTTVVDAGSPGWENFQTFKAQTIDQSKTRVLCFLNIVGKGMRGGPYEQDLNDMNAKLAAMTALQHPEYIIGIKLAHYSGPEWAPVERAVEAGTTAGIPVMIDFGGNKDPLSLETLFMEKLRPGDIFTHCFADVVGRMPIVNPQRKLRPFIKAAQHRGIIFDVGHGGGSFRFDQAIPALKEGFIPNSISTDLHTGSMNGGMKDMLNVMSKFLNMELPLQKVIELSTWAPAQIINRPELGHLTVGSEADLAVLSLEKGDFGFIDVKGWKIMGDQKLQCELTLRAGAVVWDLNGMASPTWSE